MSSQKPFILGFAAHSGTGKTYLLKQLIPILKQRGLSIGLIKHSHHDFEIDYPGKDSYELRAAGASPIMVVSPYRRATITEFKPLQEIRLHDQLTFFPIHDVDLILVEGFRHESFAKIELFRPSLGKELLYPKDNSIIAFASDQALDTPEHLPCLDLNSPQAIANFIFDYFFKQKS